MSAAAAFVPLSLKRSSYLGMPEEYRAAPRAPFRSDGSPAGPRPAERMVAQRKGEVRHRTFNPHLCNVRD